MRILERRDRMDWWLTRPEWMRKAPLVLMMLMLLVIVAGAGAMIRTGPLAPSSRAGSSDAVSLAPPGGAEIQQQTAPVSVSSITEEKEVLAGQAVAQAPSKEQLREYEKEIFAEVNKRRVENGVKALVWDDAVAEVARQHSRDMAARGYFSHVSPEGVDPWQRLQKARLPIGAGSENIRGSYWDVQLDVDGWMASPGHRMNILDARVHRTGVGVAIGTEYPLITQDFTS